MLKIPPLPEPKLYRFKGKKPFWFVADLSAYMTQEEFFDFVKIDFVKTLEYMADLAKGEIPLRAGWRFYKLFTPHMNIKNGIREVRFLLRNTNSIDKEDVIQELLYITHKYKIIGKHRRFYNVWVKHLFYFLLPQIRQTLQNLYWENKLIYHYENLEYQKQEEAIEEIDFKKRFDKLKDLYNYKYNTYYDYLLYLSLEKEYTNEKVQAAMMIEYRQQWKRIVQKYPKIYDIINELTKERIRNDMPFVKQTQEINND